MKKILIAEDNELNMKLFFDILQYQKYNVTKAYNGKIAFEFLKNNIYDLLILDVKMPEMDAFEILEQAKKDKIKLPPIMMVSACAMETDKIKAKSYGIKNYITKPIDISKFVKTVKEELSI